MRYVAVRDPASLPITTRALAIPAKRFDRPVLGYLTKEQIAAILAAPDRTTWSGRRDAILLAVAYNTGARVQEAADLRIEHLGLERAHGWSAKGRTAWISSFIPGILLRRGASGQRTSRSSANFSRPSTRSSSSLSAVSVPGCAV